MATGRTLLLLFTSVLLLVTLFRFSAPSHRSPAIHFDGFERVLSWLQGKTDNNFEVLQIAEDQPKSKTSVSSIGSDVSRSIVNEMDSDQVFQTSEVLSGIESESNHTETSVYSDQILTHQEANSIILEVGNKNKAPGVQVMEVLEEVDTEQDDHGVYLSPFVSNVSHTNFDGIRPCKEKSVNKMDSDQDFQSSEVLPGIDSESNHKETSVYLGQASTHQELNSMILEVVNKSKAPAIEEMEQVLVEADSKQDAMQEMERVVKVLEKADSKKDDHGAYLSPIDENYTIATLNENSNQYFVSVEKANSDSDLDDILLSKENFSNFVSENKYVAVQFYMPWAYRNELQALDYAEAATILEGKVVFAKVDAIVERELAMKYKFVGISTLSFFIDGVHSYTYRHCCNRDNVVSLLKEKMKGGVRSVIRPSKAWNILKSDSMIVLAFLDSLEAPESKEFAAASDLEKDVIFYQTDRRYILTLLGLDSQVQGPALFMLRKDAKIFIKFDGPFNKWAIAEFVSKNKFPLVTTFNAHNALMILRNPIKQARYYIHNCC
ncbi:uncharacterized protein LOC126661988 [Mercurialis annua]|uniref:uncharacterized protein LOC126661988 n=1 Tax=Mercurialis annua TaxID=3986 RepID=UPI0024AF8D71|nr:uncharacterized protein LOC126661988 [Mercurialis annua]